jgi:hypothetical protein
MLNHAGNKDFQPPARENARKIKFCRKAFFL